MSASPSPGTGRLAPRKTPKALVLGFIREFLGPCTRVFLRHGYTWELFYDTSVLEHTVLENDSAHRRTMFLVASRPVDFRKVHCRYLAVFISQNLRAVKRQANLGLLAIQFPHYGPQLVVFTHIHPHFGHIAQFPAIREACRRCTGHSMNSVT